MGDKFCKALIENDRATLKTIINGKLDTLSSANDLDQNFELMKAWMEEFECVSSVEIVSGVLRTDPPIKEFIVTVKNSLNETKIRNIGIWIFPEKLRFNYR